MPALGRAYGIETFVDEQLLDVPEVYFEAGEHSELICVSTRAFERLIDYLRARREDGSDTFFIQHIHAPDQAQRLVERGREIYGRDPEFVSEIGPVIGAHVGPGLLGVSGIRRALMYPAG